MKNLKIFLTTLLIATLIIMVSNVVFATETYYENRVFEIQDLGATPTPTSAMPTSSTPTPTLPSTSTPTPITISTPTPVSTPVVTPTPKTNNTSVYNNTNLPKAGSADSIAVIAIIAVFGISALYAYKKIKDYNLK